MKRTWPSGPLSPPPPLKGFLLCYHIYEPGGICEQGMSMGSHIYQHLWLVSLVLAVVFPVCFPICKRACLFSSRFAHSVSAGLEQVGPMSHVRLLSVESWASTEPWQAFSKLAVIQPLVLSILNLHIAGFRDSSD